MKRTLDINMVLTTLNAFIFIVLYFFIEIKYQDELLVFFSIIWLCCAIGFSLEHPYDYEVKADSFKDYCDEIIAKGSRDIPSLIFRIWFFANIISVAYFFIFLVFYFKVFYLFLPIVILVGFVFAVSKMVRK